MKFKIITINNQNQEEKNQSAILPQKVVNDINRTDYDNIAIISSWEGEAIYNANYIAREFKTIVNKHPEFCFSTNGRKPLDDDALFKDIYVAFNILSPYLDDANLLVIAMDKSQSKKFLYYIGEYFCLPRGNLHVCNEDDEALQLIVDGYEGRIEVIR